MFFEFVIDDGGARVFVTRLANGTHVHKHFCARLDDLFADVVDMR